MDKGGIESDINFPKVLFMHLNRMAMSLDQISMDANVDMLETLLFPYIDKEYEESLKQADKERRNKMVTGGEHDAVFTRSKARTLMVLAQRNGLLLEKIGYGYDTNEEEDDDEKF